MPQFFCEITTLDMSHVVPVKSTSVILQNVVVFSKHINFTTSKNCFHSFLGRIQGIKTTFSKLTDLYVEITGYLGWNDKWL